MKPELTAKDIERLLSAAGKAAENAYAPYSHKPQGAAVMSADGEIYCGASVEFATYGGSLSADAVCLANAVSNGKRKFVALAIQPFDWPSGVVRQYYAEFGINIHLVVPDHDGNYKLVHWSELLPEHFGPDNLEAAK